jgi:hypothetical protein
LCTISILMRKGWINLKKAIQSRRKCS